MNTTAIDIPKQKRKGGRFYTYAGVDYPSVTTILSVISKPALVAWAAKVERELVIAEAGKLFEAAYRSASGLSSATFCLRLNEMLGNEKAHTKELAKAGEIGSQVHALIEWQLRLELMEEVGPSPEIGPQAQLAYAGFQRWRQSVNLKPIWVERSVVSKKHGFAGTADLLAEVNGIETLLDWKSGKAIYPESYLQNVAYRQAIAEMEFGRPVRGMIVRLPKTVDDPEFQVHEVPSNEDALMEVFLNALALWKWQNQKEAA